MDRPDLEENPADHAAQNIGEKPRAMVPSMLRSLRHRNYQLFFGGQLISLTGTWMQSVAQAWLVYRLTGSSLLLGMIGFCGQIPVFVLAPFGGAIADRRNRHRILVITQTTSMLLAFGLAALTLAARVTVPDIFFFSTLLGIVNAFDIPARQAFVLQIVDKDDLLNAIALNSSMLNGARIVGPAIAGLLVSAIGEGWCFFANGASFIAVIAGLLAMRVPPRAAPAAKASTLADIAEGFRFVAHTKPIRALLLLLGLVSLTAMPYSVLMPIFADQILHGGPRGLGVLMGAAGVGALLGALILAARQEIKGLGRLVALACGGFGVSLVLFSSSRLFWLSALLLVPTGFAMLVQMAGSNTLIQSMTPDALRGRVLAVYSMMFMGMAPFGALLAGVLADRIGAPRTVGAGGVICIAGALAFARALPSLREGARRLILAQQAAGGDPPEHAS